MKSLVFAAVLAVTMAGPALADEMMSTTTPQLALPEPEAVPMLLPHSSVTETAPLALPEPETEAIAPYQRCSDRDTPTT